MFKRNKNQVGNSAPALPGNHAAANNSSDAILQELAIDYMHDKKIRRRWKFFWFGLFALYVIATLLFASGGNGPAGYHKPHTALVELNGVIGAESGASADTINDSLRKAFESKQSKGVILRINSPGGAPVQSADINDEITRLRELFPDKPMHVVISDMAASGGYFVAVAADQIFANRSSIVGSIGVRMDSFGFVDAIKKYGIERRSMTAGKNKSIFDPFLPVKASQQRHIYKMLDQVHQHFIETVKQGRGERISDDPDVYSGLFWTGEEALGLGLIDAFGSLDYVARDVIGYKDIVDYTYRPNLLDQLSKDFGVAVGAGIANVISGQIKLQ